MRGNSSAHPTESSSICINKEIRRSKSIENWLNFDILVLVSTNMLQNSASTFHNDISKQTTS